MSSHWKCKTRTLDCGSSQCLKYQALYSQGRSKEVLMFCWITVFVGLLSSNLLCLQTYPVLLASWNRCHNVREKRSVVWRKSGWLSPLCRWILSGCRQSFEVQWNDAELHTQCSSGMPHRSAAHLRVSWRHSCPCCIVIWTQTLLVVVGCICVSSAVMQMCLCTSTRESWAYTAGTPLGCRW